MSPNPRNPQHVLGPAPLVLLILTAAALLLAGCTSGSSDPSGSQVDSDVEIQDMKYVPATFTVQVGEEVIWVNKDAMQHTVTPTDKDLWGTEGSGDASGDWLGKGETWSHTFTEPGEYEYRCIPHSWETDDGWQGQVGTIIVE